ncbi:uncharacterized protein LOC119028920 [Acanthopagrus latus]|uniref:uncharacterized protein LOC119028920 n=1 Tax=Acanthopagrus latus TaxID=8177 RepID=UPI00187C7DDC|nr:uncharacterized protein LOC119028920 [Acanthopagrus latus]
MDLVQFFTLSLSCWWTAAARYYFSNNPKLIVTDEIEDGGTVEVTCILPIDYTGGDCRLYREDSLSPLRVMTARSFLCVFHLTSAELLGRRPVGSRIYLKCDYHLQQYTSAFSDIKGVTVSGSSPSPRLSVSRRLLSPGDSVEVTCSPPLRYVSSCQFYRDSVIITRGSCSRNLTGQQLAIWEKSTTLLPVNMTCRYDPHDHLEIRSEPSNHHMLFVVDVTQVSSSVNCSVSVDDDQLTGFADSNRMFVGADGVLVSLQVTNSSLKSDHTCSHSP